MVCLRLSYLELEHGHQLVNPKAPNSDEVACKDKALKIIDRIG
jgi:hypothetical protein